VQRRAADRIGDHRLDGRVVVVDGVVVLAPPDVGIGAQGAGAPHLPVRLVAAKILGRDPAAPLDADDAQTRASETPSYRRPDGASPDYHHVGFDIRHCDLPHAGTGAA
jgi:hypothetical protein